MLPERVDRVVKVESLYVSEPTIVIIRGIPGSGKSHLTNKLQESIGDDKIETIDPDTIDRSDPKYVCFCNNLNENGVDPKFHPYRYLLARADYAIANKKIVVWDQPFIDLEGFEITVEKLSEISKKHNVQLKILIVEIEIDSKIAMDRVHKRKNEGGHGPSPKSFSLYAKGYRSFADKGYKVITLNGEDDVNVSLSATIKAINALWNKKTK